MCFFLGTHCGGRRCAFSLHPPTRFYFLTGSPCYLLCFLFFISIIVFFWLHFIFFAVHIDLCLCTSFMFFLGTHCRGPPHPLLFFIGFPCYLLSCLLFISIVSWGSFSLSFFFQNIHRDLCLCASFLIFSFLLAIYPLRLVPMCFSLGTHCGGRRCALPPAPPHPLLFFKPVPLATYYSFLFA